MIAATPLSYFSLPVFSGLSSLQFSCLDFDIHDIHEYKSASAGYASEEQMIWNIINAVTLPQFR